MKKRFNKTGLLVICLVVSVLAHLLPFYALRLFATYNFAGPVTAPRVVSVDLAQLAEPPAEEEEQQEEEKQSELPPSPEEVESEEELPEPESVQTPPQAVETKQIKSAVEPPKVPSSPAAKPPKAIAGTPTTTILNGLLPTNYEKLTYQVTIFGLPIGDAELEAKREIGETTLTLRVKSNSTISNVFPVDNTIVTRHISNRYIMSTIRQHEGTYVSDEGFTINLKRKRVTWYNNVTGRSQITTVPTDEVIDTLSGIYYLRNRQLQVGKAEKLQIFDSEVFAEVPVEILRREKIRLPNYTEIDTLVIRPIQKTAGIFRRTGDILIWITDDANKVPVKIVTSIALGTVTADLISSDVKLPEPAVVPVIKK